MAGPLYRQIAGDLRRKIESGELGQRTQLPTEDQLMVSYHASRNTVRNALKELTTRGLVYTLHGKGTFVSELVSPILTTLTIDPKKGRGGAEVLLYTAEIAASGRLLSVRGPVVEVSKANPVVAHSLRISEGTDVIIRHEKRYVDGLPWSMQTSFYPRSLSGRASRLLDTEDIEEGTAAYLAECGIQQVGYHDEIGWRSPNEGETAYFDLPTDGHIQIVEVRRFSFDQDKNRIRFTVTVYRADRNRFVINVGDVPSTDLY
jgi:GntR family transcriptional regulator